MGVAQKLFAALRALTADRVYPDTFPQDYLWPAIRYTLISAVPGETVCGDGEDETADYRVQIDGVARTDLQRDTLRAAIRSAMREFSPPAICIAWENSYDPETKAYRARLDYLIHPSSAADPT